MQYLANGVVNVRIFSSRHSWSHPSSHRESEGQALPSVVGIRDFRIRTRLPHALIMKRIIHTRFRTPGPIVAWPKEFVVLTGFTTLEQVWPRAEAELRTLHENRLADQALGNEIETMGCWYTRLTGYLPKGTPEPGWVAALAPEEGAALALRHDQESIYVVRGDELSLRNCEVGSEIKMGSWRERVTA